MDAELQRAHAQLALARRLQAGAAAILAARTLSEVDAKLVEILPESTGFERVAVLTLPTMQEAAQVASVRGGSALDLSAIPPHSPLAAGGFPNAPIAGVASNGAPHGDVRGFYLLAPLLERGRPAALLYADALRSDVDSAQAVEAAGLAIGLASVVRANISLAAERERLLADLEAAARTDALTSLPNRAVLEERLSQELQRSARSRRAFGLAIFDLDHFGRINESFGQFAGDEALAAFAAALRSRARHVDFVARFEADRFGMLLVDVDQRAASAIVERVLDAVSQMALAFPIRLSATAGVALSYPADTVLSVVERARTALDTAKKTGRGSAAIL